MNELLKDLNESQQLAVTYTDGPQLVIAGAGSGKTRVLTYKIAFLIKSGMKPWNILALTFTNKAAKEMKLRIGTLVGQEMADRIYMGTFHSVFSRILRVEAEKIGYTSSFTIYDESDSRSLLKSMIKERGLDDKIYKPSTVHSVISNAKNHLILPDSYSTRPEFASRDQNNHMPELANLYASYVQRCRKANAMDFDDLLVLTYRLFNTNEEIRAHYRDRFQYVLVDEYQDTNYAQQAIIWLLTKDQQNICVVGDDAQSIYAFRGANIDNILNFQKIYKESRLFKLEQNYRSTQRIVLAANSLIKHNERQIPKEVFSENEQGEKLLFKDLYSDREEAIVVCKDIQRIKREEKGQYKDFAILYRTNAQSKTFEEEMRKRGIRYRIFGGLSFYQRKEIKDIIAYFRLVVNPDDEEAFKRIINYPTRGIGNTTLDKIASSAQQNGISFWQSISEPELYLSSVNKGTINKLKAFQAFIEENVLKANITDAYTLGQQIMKASGIIADIYSNSDVEGIARQQNLDALLAGLEEFVEGKKEEGKENEIFLSDYLQEVALLTDLDSDDGDDDRVSLMTVHAAKGLEFQTVFIVGLEENIFPSQMSINSPREVEEERRLLYVAITRAEKHCILTCAKNRWRYGKMEFGTPSRFIRDIDQKYLSVESQIESVDSFQNQRKARFNKNSQFSSFSDDNMDSPFFENQRRASYRDDRIQNSRPVASQFRADVKPKITNPERSKEVVNPFSERFQKKFEASGGNLKKVSKLLGSESSSNTLNESSSIKNLLVEGNIIEHQRFGVGNVIRVEGSGENTKATVEFKNSGVKQLLLKFAKFKILS